MPKAIGCTMVLILLVLVGCSGGGGSGSVKLGDVKCASSDVNVSALGAVTQTGFDTPGAYRVDATVTVKCGIQAVPGVPVTVAYWWSGSDTNPTNSQGIAGFSKPWEPSKPIDSEDTFDLKVKVKGGGEQEVSVRVP